MTIFNPDFCEKHCPVCTAARKGNRLAGILQHIETLVTFGGCPWRLHRQRKYGVRPDQPLGANASDGIEPRPTPR